jgi:hypothetical protein
VGLPSSIHVVMFLFSLLLSSVHPTVAYVLVLPAVYTLHDVAGFSSVADFHTDSIIDFMMFLLSLLLLSSLMFVNDVPAVADLPTCCC